MKFRKLYADEIEVRVGQVSRDGSKVSLLLYKDARVDMRILDETVGPENWQREHYECKGNLFCRVGIYCFVENGFSKWEGWVWKADVGTESNAEKEKGESSDSFKRACFNWGIGRELYTGPRIAITGEDAKVDNDKKVPPYIKFKVTEIGYDDDGNIDRLTIARVDFGNKLTTVFSWGLTEDLTGIKLVPSEKVAPQRTGKPAKEFKR